MPDAPPRPSGYLGINRRPSRREWRRALISAGSSYNVNVVPTVYVIKQGRVAYAGTGLDGVNGLGAAVAKAAGG